MNKIFAPFLPPWAETGLQPAFYDVESGTVLQQTARMYDKVNQLIRLFNEFSEATSEEVNAFEREVNETVEEYIEKFTELKDFVEDYFENLDVQEEINHKLDEMAEDGKLEEIMADYLQTRAIFAFDTVADMKNADNLVDGSYAETLGYHSKNDGGSALYKIRTSTVDDTVDDMFIVEIGDGADNLVAELIYDEVDVKQIGAYGDGTHDDTTVLQAAFDKNATVYMPKGDYLIESSVDIKDKANDSEAYVLKASEAKITYTGNNYAFNIQNVANARLDFGVIRSTTGGCLNMYATGGSGSTYDYIQYVVINFKVMQAGSTKDCVYASTVDNGWINEITFENGRFYGNAANGFHVTYGCNNWNFNNIGFEGCVTGVYLENTNSEHAMGHYTMHECRHSENITNYLKADGVGDIRDVFIFYSWKLDTFKIITNEHCDDWYAYSRDNIGSHLVAGNWQYSTVLKTLEGGQNIGGGSNLNDFVIAGDYNLNQTGYFNTATNKPNTASLGKLSVQNFNNFRYQNCPYILQTYTTTEGHIFQRTFDGNSWTAWDLINGCACMEFADNTNLNNLRHGSFVCTSSAKKATLTNIPSGVANLFRLDIERFGVQSSGTSCIQKIYDGDTNMYIRTAQGSTWSAWKQVAYTV